MSGLSIEAIRARKGGAKLAMLTCYDTPSARMVDDLGLDFLLVGDSLGEVVHGFPSTTFVTNALMEIHVAAVRRGATNTHVVADMCAGTYDDPAAAVRHAKVLIAAGADSLKLETPKTEVIRALAGEGIAVHGHVGLTPQTIHDYRKQGKDAESAARILADAVRQADAGCYAILVEAVPSALAKAITEAVPVPTIGIAAGPDCDGQVIVWHDLFGYDEKIRPYVKKHAFVRETVREGLGRWIGGVRSGGA